MIKPEGICSVLGTRMLVYFNDAMFSPSVCILHSHMENKEGGKFAKTAYRAWSSQPINYSIEGWPPSYFNLGKFPGNSRKRPYDATRTTGVQNFDKRWRSIRPCLGKRVNPSGFLPRYMSGGWEGWIMADATSFAFEQKDECVQDVLHFKRHSDHEISILFV